MYFYFPIALKHLFSSLVLFTVFALQTSILILIHIPIPNFTSIHSPCHLPTFFTYNYYCYTNSIQAWITPLFHPYTYNFLIFIYIFSLLYLYKLCNTHLSMLALIQSTDRYYMCVCWTQLMHSRCCIQSWPCSLRCS